MTQSTGRTPRRQATSTLDRSSKALDTALKLIKLGFWVVAIHPRTKRPIGKAWGLERWDEERLREAFERYPDAGIGICLGPGRAPDGRDLIDLEGDGDRAEESLSNILGSEIPGTTAWSSRRGEHNLFVADLDRLQRALIAAGAVEGTDEKGKGAWHLPGLPGLEFRTGGYKADGTVKQVQSVIPPTPGDDGEPRRWTGSPKGGIATLPESAYAALEGLAATRKQAKPQPAAKRGSRKAAPDGRDGYARAALKKECDAVEAATEGTRNSRLNTAAFSLGQLIGSQALGRLEVERALLESARRAGLGEGESTATIRSGIDAGMVKPRDLNGIGERPPPPSPPPDGDRDDGSQDGALAKKPKTDYGNAERLVARHGNNIRYCHPWSKWLRYDGQRWKIDDIGAVHRLAKDAARKVFREAVAIDDKDERKAHVAWGFTSESRARIESMLTMATSEEGIPILPDDLDGDVWLFNCPNGTVDLKTGLMRGHRREDCISQLCPVEFDPSARCPLWDKTLNLLLRQRCRADRLLPMPLRLFPGRSDPRSHHAHCLREGEQRQEHDPGNPAGNIRSRLRHEVSARHAHGQEERFPPHGSHRLVRQTIGSRHRIRYRTSVERNDGQGTHRRRSHPGSQDAGRQLGVQAHSHAVHGDEP